MSQNTLLILENILKKYNFDVEVTKKVCSFFSTYNKNEWVYPGVFKRKFGIPIKNVYVIFNELEQNKVVKSYYEVCCKKCKRTLGTVYESFDEVPNEEYCDYCGCEVNAAKNSYLIYKVI